MKLQLWAMPDNQAVALPTETIIVSSMLYRKLYQASSSEVPAERKKLIGECVEIIRVIGSSDVYVYMDGLSELRYEAVFKICHEIRTVIRVDIWITRLYPSARDVFLKGTLSFLQDMQDVLAEADFTHTKVTV